MGNGFGEIFHVMLDPVPTEVRQHFLDGNGDAEYLDIPPVYPPERPETDNEGNVVLGKDGAPVMVQDDPDITYASPFDHFVLNGQVFEKPEFVLSDEVSLTVGQVQQFFNIPVGTTLSFEGETYTIDDGLWEIEADATGVFVYTLSLFPYKRKVVKVVVS